MHFWIVRVVVFQQICCVYDDESHQGFGGTGCITYYRHVFCGWWIYTRNSIFYSAKRKKKKKKCVVFASPSLSHMTINLNFQKIIFLVKGVIIFLQELCSKLKRKLQSLDVRAIWIPQRWTNKRFYGWNSNWKYNSSL